VGLRRATAPHGPGRTASQRRQRGWIEELPSGPFRVRVYAGVDPLTGRNHYLGETVETRKDAERTRTRLLSQVDENRTPAPARP
jgi:hypothetical protein